MLEFGVAAHGAVIQLAGLGYHSFDSTILLILFISFIDIFMVLAALIKHALYYQLSNKYMPIKTAVEYRANALILPTNNRIHLG